MNENWAEAREVLSRIPSNLSDINLSLVGEVMEMKKKFFFDRELSHYIHMHTVSLRRTTLVGAGGMIRMSLKEEKGTGVDISHWDPDTAMQFRAKTRDICFEQFFIDGKSILHVAKNWDGSSQMYT